MIRLVKKEVGEQNLTSIHLHNTRGLGLANALAALEEGITTLDSSLGGIGGCPFANDELVGNIATQTILNFIQNNNLDHNLNMLNLETAYNESKSLFKF